MPGFTRAVRLSVTLDAYLKAGKKFNIHLLSGLLDTSDTAASAATTTDNTSGDNGQDGRDNQAKGSDGSHLTAH